MKTRSAHRSLLIVGSVAFDDIDGPFGMHENMLGGSASFIARAASYFTHDVSVIGVVGDDTLGRFVIEQLIQRGVDTRGVRVDPPSPEIEEMFTIEASWPRSR